MPRHAAPLRVDLLEVPGDDQEQDRLHGKDDHDRDQSVPWVVQVAPRDARPVAVGGPERVVCNLVEAPVERKAGDQLDEDHPPVSRRHQLGQQQVADEARRKHVQEPRDGAGARRGKGRRQQKRGGHEAPGPQQVEHELERVVRLREERQADGGSHPDQDPHVDQVHDEVPDVLHHPVDAVAQAVHLHHAPQPVLLLRDQRRQHDGQQQLQHPRVEEHADQRRNVQLELGSRLGHGHGPDEAREAGRAHAPPQERICCRVNGRLNPHDHRWRLSVAGVPPRGVVPKPHRVPAGVEVRRAEIPRVCVLVDLRASVVLLGHTSRLPVPAVQHLVDGVCRLDIDLLRLQRARRQRHDQVSGDGIHQLHGILRPRRRVIIREHGQRPVVLAVRPERRLQVVVVVRVLLERADRQPQERRPDVLRPGLLSPLRKRLRPRGVPRRHVWHRKQVDITDHLGAVPRDQHRRVGRLWLGQVPHARHLRHRRPDRRALDLTPHELPRV